MTGLTVDNFIIPLNCKVVYFFMTVSYKVHYINMFKQYRDIITGVKMTIFN